MALTENETKICNQAIDLFGSTRFTLANQGTNTLGIKSELHYDQTRDALLRSFTWSFATKRKKLYPDTSTPDFGPDFRYKLPLDFWRLKEDASINDNTRVKYRPVIESGYLLSNENEVNLIYIRKVTDPAEFDPLFTEVLILRLAKKLRPSIAGTKSPALYQEIDNNLVEAERSARLVCRQETNFSGRSDWNQARFTASGGEVAINGTESYGS